MSCMFYAPVSAEVLDGVARVGSHEGGSYCTDLVGLWAECRLLDGALDLSLDLIAMVSCPDEVGRSRAGISCGAAAPLFVWSVGDLVV